MLNKKLESGRSMVEMLGVLAIIGVLSVGGIAGYTMAMNKYKANEIVNGISTIYMLGMSANKGQGSTTDMLYSTTVSPTVPSGASEITYKTDKTVVAAITDTGVCDQVKNQLGDKATGDCGALVVTLGDAGATSGVDQTACEEVGGTVIASGKYCLVIHHRYWQDASRSSCGSSMSMVSLSDFGCENLNDGDDCPAAKNDPDLVLTDVWTSDCYDDACKSDYNSNSGRAYILVNGSVGTRYRDGGAAYESNALCK